MDDQWRADDPPIGIFALVDSISAGEFIATCVFNCSGDKVWESRHGREYDLEKIDRWLPITTPEEMRLRKRVEELIKAIEKHKDSISCLMDYCDNEANKELWANLPEGGGDG